ncbi:MAG TPA: FtsQ-type POTRA domain-containing protein, partial [Tenericutes bacterium]|nr:FtsQ-type POTRA domain-containing protein [Mycoplasmatota bacterium]
IKIKNIFITGNKILSDQEIIEIAKISDYPSNLKNPSMVIKNRLLKNTYIKKVKVNKKRFNQLYINIEENRPIFYNSNIKKVILSNSDVVSDNFVVPILINYVPDTIYNKFIEKMSEVEDSIINRMSEIKYNPNDVDDERFLVSMSDGNYVYLTLKSFSNINEYINIIKNFNTKKGILYLDSGEYFQVFEN